MRARMMTPEATRALVEDYLRFGDDSVVGILPYALAIAARMRVADLVHAGTRQLTDLAAALEMDPDSLGRLLRALVSCGFMEQSPDGGFVLTPLCDVLRSDSPQSQRTRLGNLDSFRAWLAAADAMEIGRTAFERTFNATFFGHKEADADAGRLFDRRTQERTTCLYLDQVVRHDWSESRRVLDVGGGIGTVLAAVLEAAPHLEGVLFDRRQVLERIGPDSPATRVDARCTYAAGDFFEALPAGADTHLMCSVLHDWDDERALLILRSSARALEPGGRLVVCEMLLPDSPRWHPATWSDLGMMVVVGGRERTRREFERLLEAAGFTLVSATESADSSFAMLDARRVDH
jgi:ubiquinone/menaquinone biosynthesis C-methylase UbiE